MGRKWPRAGPSSRLVWLEQRRGKGVWKVRMAVGGRSMEAVNAMPSPGTWSEGWKSCASFKKLKKQQPKSGHGVPQTRPLFLFLEPCWGLTRRAKTVVSVVGDLCLSHSPLPSPSLPSLSPVLPPSFGLPLAARPPCTRSCPRGQLYTHVCPILLYRPACRFQTSPSSNLFRRH